MAFNLFGKKTKDQTGGIFTDKTYISTTAKMNACLDLANKEPDTVFISWFDETTRKFKEFFAQNGLEEPRVIQSRFLHTQMLQNKKAILVEHYPLHAKEMELVHNWPQEDIMVFSAMDEPLFKFFGSEKVIPLMKMLGMKEEKAVEHPMVSKSIINAQQKIASKVITEQPANSQAEWMEKNMK